jgi:hypothetical protein
MTIDGQLTRWTEYSDTTIFNNPRMLAIREHLYPFCLVSGTFRDPGYCAIAAGVVFFLCFFYKGFPLLRQIRAPSSHPTAVRVQSWGDPIVLSAEIQKEYQTNPQFARRPTLGEHYLILYSFFEFDVHRFTDLVWAYKRITKKTVNFIPTGTNYEAVLVFSDGDVVIRNREKEVEDMLQFAAQRAPQAFFGYSMENIQKIAASSYEAKLAVARHALNRRLR